MYDNSFTDNSTLAAECLNSLYIPNRSNMGIAKATNIGCQKALSDGFKWIMTMDQDSSWDFEELNKYLKLINNDNLDIQAQQKGRIKFPKDNILKCDCGYEMNLVDIRNNVESQIGVKTIE